MSDQQNIDNLVDELQRFTKSMKSWIDAGGNSSTSNSKSTDASTSTGSFDKSATKIVNAIGILNNSILGNSKQNINKDKSLEKFNKAVDKATKVSEEATKVEEEKIKAAEKALEQQRESMKNWAKTTEQRDRETAEAVKKERAEKKANAVKETRHNISRITSGEALIEHIESLSGGMKRVGTAFVGIGGALDGAMKGVTSYTTAIYKGERGLAVSARSMNEGMESAVDGVATVAKAFGPWGQVMGTLIDGANFLFKKYNKVSEEAAKQADTLFKSFNELSKVGGTTSEGLEGVQKSAQRLGFSMSEMDAYNKLIIGNSKDIKAFGATVAEGGTKLGKLTDELYNGEFGRGLQNMGVQLDEQREAALAYMTIQARSGQLMKQNDAQLVAGTANFVKELDEAATLTGTSRKEQQEARLNAQADAQFRAAMRVAERNNDQKKIAKLKSAELLAGQVSPYDKDGAAGILRHAAGGWAAGEGAQAAAWQYGANKIKGGESNAELAELASSSVGKNQRQFDVINQFTPTVAGVQQNPVGAANYAQSIETSKKEAAKQGLTLEQYTAKKEAAKQKGSPSLGKMNEVDRMQRETAINLDNSVSAFSGATDKYASATNVMKKATDKLSNALTDGEVGGFGSTGGSSSGTRGASGSGNSGGGGTRGASGSGNSGGGVNSGGAAFVSPKMMPNRSDTKKHYETLYNTLLAEATKAGLQNPEAIARLGAAQSSLETGHGKSLAGGNNYFGIKSKRGDANASVVDTSEWDPVSGKYVTTKAGFRKYDSMQSSAADYIKFLQENKRYADVLNAKTPNEAIQAQSRTGYATDPDYGNKLQTIHNNSLTKPGARTGGIFRGPSTGYDVTLHGDEMVVPANDGVSKQTLNSSVFNQDNSMMEKMMDVFSMMSDKFDTMIELLDDGNINRKKLLSAMT